MMRKNKFIKLIEHILVTLPLLMVLVTCCYTIWNSNANQSYYGDTINEKTYTSIHDKDLLDINNNYTIVFGGSSIDMAQGIGGSDNRLNFTLINVFENRTSLDVSTATSVGFYRVDSNRYITYWYNSSNTSLGTIDFGGSTNNYLSIEIQYVSNTLTNRNILTYGDVLYLVNFNDYSYLSNVFEYSLSEFNDMGFGKINFTGFFVDMFHNGQTNVYIDFANSYLNYMLFIECTFVLPLVLYWFIHIGEIILYKFEKGEW